jgi:hypothetical protein
MRLQIIKNKDGREGVHVDGGKLIGHVMRLEDGYYSFEFLSENTGVYSSYDLRIISELLDGLNESWNTEVNKYFDSLGSIETYDEDIF